MSEWFSTYNETVGLYHASIITTIFGSFCVAFVIALCWPKLVEMYGALGGMIGGAVIVATFWVLNHKLPGLGIAADGIEHPDGGIQQFGLIAQAFRGAAPWVDMGLAVGVGMWVASYCDGRRQGGKSAALALESLPRLLCVLFGGVLGGTLVALIRFSGAAL
jgi:hypothetical protein